MKTVQIANNCLSIISKSWNRAISSPLKCRCAKHCGKNVRFGRRTSITGWENVYIGNKVSFNDEFRVLSTRASVIIGDNVMFGPRCTIITGDHRTDLLDRPMCEVTDLEKLPENDADVVIEGDNWIGANAVILKGVTIGKGAVVGAGSVLTKSIPAYAVCAGVPAKILYYRTGIDSEMIQCNGESNE